MPVRNRIIDGPVGVPVLPVGIAAKSVVRYSGIHQARENPFGLIHVIGRQRVVGMLPAWVLAERQLPRGGCPDHDQRCDEKAGRHGSYFGAMTERASSMRALSMLSNESILIPVMRL